MQDRPSRPPLSQQQRRCPPPRDWPGSPTTAGPQGPGARAEVAGSSGVSNVCPGWGSPHGWDTGETSVSGGWALGPSHQVPRTRSRKLGPREGLPDPRSQPVHSVTHRDAPVTAESLTDRDSPGCRPRPSRGPSPGCSGSGVGGGGGRGDGICLTDFKDQEFPDVSPIPAPPHLAPGAFLMKAPLGGGAAPSGTPGCGGMSG